MSAETPKISDYTPWISYCIVKGCRRAVPARERDMAQEVILREPDYCAWCAKPVSERARAWGDRQMTGYRTDYQQACEVRA